MSVNVYSVIWADDECITLEKDKNIRQLFDVKHIEVLAYVQTSEELKDKIETYKDRVDAIIVDGNFSKSPVEYLEPKAFFFENVKEDNRYHYWQYVT